MGWKKNLEIQYVLSTSFTPPVRQQYFQKFKRGANASLLRHRYSQFSNVSFEVLVAF